MGNLSSVIQGSSTGATVVLEKNYVKAPDAPGSLWVASGAGITVATETTAINLPENNSKTSAIKIQRASGTDYVRYRFVLDRADSGKKLKISWNQIYTGTAGDYTLTIVSYTDSGYTTGVTTLSTSISSIPAITGTVTASFDAPAFSAAPYIEVRINGIAGTAALYLSGVTVGPGSLSQGAVISEWQTYTPTLTNGGTTSINTGRWRRVGTTMEIQTSHSFTAAGAAGSFSIGIPPGYTIDTTAQSGASGSSAVVQGTGQYYNGTNVSIMQTLYITFTNPNGIQFVLQAGTGAFQGNSLGNNHQVGIKVAVPIAEWAGSGTVLLGQGAQTEYAFNSSTSTGTDTTSFASGPQGVAFQAFAPAGTASIAKRCRFQYPIQADDVISVEVDNGTGGARWVPLSERISTFSSNDAGSTYYGYQFSIINSTDVDVNFFSAPYVGSSWNSINSWRWRVRKAKASAPVGIAAATSSSLGLVTLAQISSGAGEKNYLATGTNDSTNWAVSGAGITATTETSAANLPENATKTSALRVLRASGSDYARFRFTLDTSDYNKKLKISWNQKYAGSTGDYTITVFSNTASDYTGTSTALAVSSSSIPAINGSYSVTFDSSGSAAPYIEIRINGIAGTTPIYLSGIVAGPGTVTQGAVISEWQSYTPSWTSTGTAPAIGNGTITGLYRRVGANMEVSITLNSGNSTTYGSGAYRFSIPTGFTFSTSQMGTLQDPIGNILVSSTATYYTGTVHYVGTGNLAGLTHSSGSDVGQTVPYTPTAATANQRYEIHATFPVSEWAGSGTTLLGPGATVEYAYNSSTTSTDDTTSFAYGPGGGALLGSNPAGGGCIKRVRFQYPIQTDDLIVVEVSPLNDGKWFSLPALDSSQFPLENLHQEGSNFFGLGIYQTPGLASNEIALKFGQYPDSHTTDSSGYNWSSYSGWRYRVRKAKASAPVGIAQAETDSLGLVKLNRFHWDNYVQNPLADSNTNGFATYADAAQATPVDGTGGSASITFTRNTSSPIWPTGDFKISKDAVNRQGNGVSYDFTLSVVDRSKKLQISFDYNTSAANYAASDLAVYIYDVSNATLITPVTTGIPKATGSFVTTFDASTSTSYRLIFHVASTNATAYDVYIDNIYVGAGVQQQGAAVGEWQAYTPVLSNAGTTSSNGGYWRRVGSVMEIATHQTFTGAGAAGAFRIAIPSGYTIDTTRLPATSFDAVDPVGTGDYYNGSAFSMLNVYVITTTTVNLIVTGAGNDILGNSLANGHRIGTKFAVPIAEWAGSGTVNLGPGAQIEYAANSGIATGAGDNSAASNTVYGPRGTSILAINSTTGNNFFTTFDVQWQYPIQNDDIVVCEILNGSTNQWHTAPDSGFGPILQGTSAYGIQVYAVSNTVTRVYFGNRGYAPTNATYAGDGSAWSSITSYRWRLRKSKASSPVGFGLATHIESGLSYRNRFQRKVLSGNITSDGAISDWTFNNLTVGKVYRLDITARLVHSSSADNQKTGIVTITHSGTTLYGPNFSINPYQTGDNIPQSTSTFVATATSITMSWSGVNMQLWAPSYASLTELNDTENTTAF